MKAVPLKIESLALSGTDSITYTLPSTGALPVSIEIGVMAHYTAVAGTSGIQAAFQISKDGTNWVNAAESNLVVAPAAGAQGFGSAKIILAGPNKRNSINAVAVKVNLTNLDDTNAAQVAVVAETSDYI